MLQLKPGLQSRKPPSLTRNSCSVVHYYISYFVTNSSIKLIMTSQFIPNQYLFLQIFIYVIIWNCFDWHITLGFHIFPIMALWFKHSSNETLCVFDMHVMFIYSCWRRNVLHVYDYTGTSSWCLDVGIKCENKVFMHPLVEWITTIIWQRKYLLTCFYQIWWYIYFCAP